ncbi:MAG: hypothetical protein GC164_04485 [Phycisphaera sp.]|nr:hypothetical protein [Phycisphaera sp.]
MRTLVTMLALTCVCLAPLGCEKKYAYRDLGLDSPEARQVEANLQRLRESAPDQRAELTKTQLDEGLKPELAQAITRALLDLASRPESKLVSVDRFGPDVYRAVFDRNANSGPNQTAFLLVKRNGDMKWVTLN